MRPRSFAALQPVLIMAHPPPLSAGTMRHRSQCDTGLGRVPHSLDLDTGFTFAVRTLAAVILAHPYCYQAGSAHLLTFVWFALADLPYAPLFTRPASRTRQH
jgi:hypothetical protein